MGDVLNSDGRRVHSVDHVGETLLHAAARNESGKAVVEYIIDRGANLNAMDHEGKTPLHAAAQTLRCEAVLRMLVDSGADVNATDYDGSTPLHLAARVPHACDLRSELIQAGANPYARDHKGLMPVSYFSRTLQQHGSECSRNYDHPYSQGHYQPLLMYSVRSALKWVRMLHQREELCLESISKGEQSSYTRALEW